MNAAIAALRDEAAETAPKIKTITIPMDKIKEVIGPMGKVINTIQQETGADISVDDDGAQGFVTIGAVEAWRMEEAMQAILNIVDPPKAEIGKTYMGRVVNITKFGAFVNILRAVTASCTSRSSVAASGSRPSRTCSSSVRRSKSSSRRSTTAARSA
ncbi:MAG: KH domain-containing protein [Ilumatobacteraceae bacterium]